MGRDPETIALSVRIRNASQMGLTGPARWLRYRAPMRGIPGIDLERRGAYVNVSFAAKREWLDDDDGWQTVHYGGRKSKPKTTKDTVGWMGRDWEWEARQEELRDWEQGQIEYSRLKFYD